MTKKFTLKNLEDVNTIKAVYDDGDYDFFSGIWMGVLNQRKHKEGNVLVYPMNSDGSKRADMSLCDVDWLLNILNNYAVKVIINPKFPDTLNARSYKSPTKKCKKFVNPKAMF
ncbi:MAG TPA: hypothetical protein O0X97_03755 [Methanocorpusculum sp.]|nr:hypothetical protein [Methanocorpusculum sp.]